MITLIIITLSFMICCVYSYIQDNMNVFTSSLIGLVLITMFGWGAYAVSCTKYIKKRDAEIIEIVKGKYIVVVYVMTPDSVSNRYTSTNIFEGYNVDLINDSTKFYWEEEYNLYNSMNSSTLKFKR